MPVSGWVKISDIFLLKFIKYYLLDLICGKNKTGILIYHIIFQFYLNNRRRRTYGKEKNS